MPSSVVLVILSAALVAAAGPEPRSGLWETGFEQDGRPQRLRVILRIFKTEYASESQKISVGASVYLGSTFQGRTVWFPFGPCYHYAEPQIKLAGDHLTFECVATQPKPNATQVAGFDGRFDPSHTQISGTLRLGDGNTIPVAFARPEVSKDNPLAGHWIASGSGQTCVLHVYNVEPNYQGAATIDVYRSEGGVFGQAVGAYVSPDSRFTIYWSDIGPISFDGAIDSSGQRLARISHKEGSGKPNLVA